MRPSHPDIDAEKKIKAAMDVLNIKVIDPAIVYCDSYTRFVETGILSGSLKNMINNI